MLSRIKELCTPTFHPLDHNLMAMRFGLMKVLPAYFRVKTMLWRRPSQRTFVETTSGTAGLGLALVCAEMGLRLKLVSDPAIEEALQFQLEALGATVLKVDQKFKNEPGGFQKARMDLLQQTLQEYPEAAWTQQYDCPDWGLAYASAVGDLLTCGTRPDILVAACGSGASGCGVSRALAKVGPITTFMVDTPGSVLFGTPEAPRDLRGLGNSIIPKNLCHELVDGVFWVHNAAALAGAYRLNCRFMDVGPTSGAAWLAARWLAHRFPTKQVVFICADDSRRYPTVNNGKAIKALGEITENDYSPKEVTHPLQVHSNERFQYFAWQRRALASVLKTS